MTTYCCDCKWSRDGGAQRNTDEMLCDHEKLSRSFVTGKKGTRKCSDINWDGNCFGFEPTKTTEEIMAEIDSNNPADS